MKRLFQGFLVFSLLCFNSGFAATIGEGNGHLGDEKSKLIKNFSKQYKAHIKRRSLKASKLTPASFAKMIKSKKDREHFLKLVKKTKMTSFPRLKFSKGTYIVPLPLGHKMTYSALNIAEGVFYIDGHKFKMKKGEKFVELSSRLKTFLRKELSEKTTGLLSDFIIDRAHALLSAEISDILVVHTAGYISINYDEADIVHTENDYAEILTDSLIAEIKDAKKECTSLNAELKDSRHNGLSDDVYAVLDSVKFKDGSYNDYLIISSLLKKHATETSDEKSPYITRSSNSVADLYRSINVAEKADNMYSSDCSYLVKAMLPNAYMPDTVKKFKKMRENICEELDDLKACYADAEKVSDKRVNNSLGIKPIEVGNMNVLETFGSEAGSAVGK